MSSTIQCGPLWVRTARRLAAILFEEPTGNQKRGRGMVRDVVADRQASPMHARGRVDEHHVGAIPQTDQTLDSPRQNGGKPARRQRRDVIIGTRPK